MKITTGIDIIEVSRIKEAIEEQKNKFLSKIFTEKEIEYCSNTGKMEYQHFASRFAAKEAVFKAISEFIKDDENEYWRKIEVINDNNGRPKVNLEIRLSKDLDSIDISISHIKELAIANVVVVFKD